MATAGSSTEQAISVSSESSAYPDFKTFHRHPPDDRLASKKNHIEQNFYILRRNTRQNRSDDIECICAFCSLTFKAFNTTKMRVHLTGQNQGAIRVAPCKCVPDACKEFYLAERDRDEAKTREREAAKTSLYQEAAKLNRAETERKRKADEEPSASLNPRTLTGTMNLKNVGQPRIESMMVN